MNKKTLIECYICSKFISTALEQSGCYKLTQVLEIVNFTDIKVYVRGKLAASGRRDWADYILYYKPNIPIEYIEVKDNNHSGRSGIQQGLDYPPIHDIPCVSCSTGDGFLSIDNGIGTADAESYFPKFLFCRKKAEILSANYNNQSC